MGSIFGSQIAGFDFRPNDNHSDGKLSAIGNITEKNGAPGKTRTPNLLIRSQTLYPIELRARGGCGHYSRLLQMTSTLKDKIARAAPYRL